MYRRIKCGICDVLVAEDRHRGCGCDTVINGYQAGCEWCSNLDCLPLHSSIGLGTKMGVHRLVPALKLFIGLKPPGPRTGAA